MFLAIQIINHSYTEARIDEVVAELLAKLIFAFISSRHFILLRTWRKQILPLVEIFHPIQHIDFTIYCFLIVMVGDWNRSKFCTVICYVVAFTIYSHTIQQFCQKHSEVHINAGPLVTSAPSMMKKCYGHQPSLDADAEHLAKRGWTRVTSQLALSWKLEDTGLESR